MRVEFRHKKGLHCVSFHRPNREKRHEEVTLHVLTVFGNQDCALSLFTQSSVFFGGRFLPKSL